MVLGDRGSVPEESPVPRSWPRTKTRKQLQSKIYQASFSLEFYLKCIFCIVCLITDSIMYIYQQKEGKAIHSVNCSN